MSGDDFWEDMRNDLLRRARRRLGADDSEDVTQEALLAVWLAKLKSKGGEPQPNEQALGRKIVKNRVAEFIRGRVQKRVSPSVAVEELASLDGYAADRRIRAALDELRRIYVWVEPTLSPDQSVAMAMVVNGEVSITRMAQSMGRSEAAMSVLLRRLGKRLNRLRLWESSRRPKRL